MERPKWWEVLGVARDAAEDVVRQAAALQQQQAQSTDTWHPSHNALWDRVVGKPAPINRVSAHLQLRRVGCVGLD